VVDNYRMFGRSEQRTQSKTPQMAACGETGQLVENRIALRQNGNKASVPSLCPIRSQSPGSETAVRGYDYRVAVFAGSGLHSVYTGVKVRVGLA
jgi:hypothetical protein